MEIEIRPLKKIVISGLVISSVLVITYITQGFSFGQFQIRLSTSLYALSYLYPFLIVPLGLANFLCNALFGGFGLPDMLGGTVVGIITSGIIALIKTYKHNIWFITLPIIIMPGLIVPIWMAYLINVPYLVLVISICIGQTIPAVLGVILIKRLIRYKI